MSKDLKIEDGQVVSMDYTLHVDGQVVDTPMGAGRWNSFREQATSSPAWSVNCTTW